MCVYDEFTNNLSKPLPRLVIIYIFPAKPLSLDEHYVFGYDTTGVFHLRINNSLYMDMCHYC